MYLKILKNDCESIMDVGYYESSEESNDSLPEDIDSTELGKVN